jgi:hypothetical protein
MWWRLTEQSQAPDGAHLLTYQLETQGQAPIEELEVLFLLSPYQRDIRGRNFGPGELYRKTVHPGQRKLVFYGGQSAKFDIWARARRGRRWLIAQTIASTFGRSGLKDPEATPLANPEIALAWPQWTMVGAERFYRAQAGQPLDLELSARPLSVKVFEDQVLMANWPGREEGVYRYVTSQNQDMAQSGYTAQKKDVVFMGDLGPLGLASFSLPVYRAYYGQLDYPKGLLVMAVVFLGTIGLVKVKGRRFQSQ